METDGRALADAQLVADARLVAEARAGDKAAFATLVARHRPMVVALCRRMVGDGALAEDAAQEAVLSALLNLDRLRRPERFGPWLAGIGLNVCRRWLRQRSRDWWSWDSAQGGRVVADPADAGSSPEELVEASELAAAVRRAVDTLPPGQRDAVTLFYLGGLSHRELAALLGIRVGAVKARLHKARANLRRELWAEWEGSRMTDDAVTMRVTDVRRLNAEGDGADKHVVLLTEADGERHLPIWIGPFEATALALTLESAEFPRPTTYHFTASVLRAAGAELRRAHVARLAERTFYAEVHVAGPGGASVIDARPSDALNLALLVGAPITAAPEVLDAAAADEAAAEDRLVSQSQAGAATIARERLAAWEQETKSA